MPKLAIFLSLTPPVALLLSHLKTLVGRLACVCLILSFRSTLIHGDMDGILGMYTAALAVYASDVLLTKKGISSLQAVMLGLLLAATSAIKNEGIAIVFLFCLLLLSYLALIDKDRIAALKCAAAMMVAIVPITIWKYRLAKAGVTNDLLQSNVPVLVRFTNHLNPHSLRLIFGAALDQRGLWLAILLFGLTYLAAKRDRVRAFVGGFALAYSGVLLMIYLITPHDLVWHLSTSIDRVVLPIMFTLALFAAWFWDTRLVRLTAPNSQLETA